VLLELLGIFFFHFTEQSFPLRSGDLAGTAGTIAFSSVLLSLINRSRSRQLPGGTFAKYG
jgi:hypothetical protein